MAAAGGDTAPAGAPAVLRTLWQLLAREQSPEYAIRPNFMETVQTHGMERGWREDIATYFTELCDFLEMPPEVHASALNILDRYLSKRSCNQLLFQLASVTAFLISAKLHGKVREYNIWTLLTSSHGHFRANDVFTMERDILNVLGWRLNAPTAVALLESFAACWRGSPAALSEPGFQRAHELVRLAANDTDSLHCPASQIAWAAIRVADPDTERRLDEAVEFAPSAEGVAFCVKRLRYLAKESQPENHDEDELLAVCAGEWTDAAADARPRLTRSPESVLDVDQSLRSPPRAQAPPSADAQPSALSQRATEGSRHRLPAPVPGRSEKRPAREAEQDHKRARRARTSASD